MGYVGVDYLDFSRDKVSGLLFWNGCECECERVGESFLYTRL